MGLIPKNKLEQLKKEKREAKAAKKRKENVRLKFAHFLIVCEGEKTEPNYFRSLVNDNNLSVIMDVDIKGEGCSTCALIRKTKEIREEIETQRLIEFDRVWVVFDKDDFEDFNKAISLAGKFNYGCAWSNEAFELWYCLHYHYLNSAISRRDYIKYLEKCICECEGYKGYRYKKNDPNIYSILQKTGSENDAKKNAEKLRSLYENCNFAKHNPCTTVDLLVEELKDSEKVLNCKK